MRILVVDDDPQVREVVVLALARAGFEAATAADGESALREARRLSPALVVLDLGLPRLHGLEVCRKLAEDGGPPVLILSAQGDEPDRVLGLELGADDYLAKPFSPRELVARVRAILKRGGGGDAPGPRHLRHGDLRLDLEARAAWAGEEALPLTATEMAMLAHLMRRPGHLVGRDRLSEAVHGPGADVSDRTVDSHLRNLRRKLAEAGLPGAVEGVHGQGVRMGPCRRA